ncbi:MAG: hypothetical protein IPK85_02140 [Gemmatimonadetes bacterium]|nr:hypothetical protein [Gemmatimonadota bacterium]
MMNRAGIGSLMRAGPAPGRAGLSHLARGEAVIPNAAMNADPSLRQRAMMAMASRGRNPSQFTVGQRNLRNPSTGAPMFADLIYTENGWVDASTGQAADFGGGNSFANSGTNYNGSANYDPVTGSVRVASFGGLPTSAGRQIGDVIQFEDMTPEQQGFYSAPTGSIGAPGSTINDLAEPFRQARQQGVEANPNMAINPVSGVNPVYGLSGPGTPQPVTQSDFPSFTAPQTYDQWQQTRNPSGKNVPNTLFGQTQTAGGNAGFSTGGMEMPNVLAGQMPVAGASWGTPGTALGFGRENTANDPSILRSGYNDLSLSPSIYSAAFGANGLMGPQSGIAFSGQNPMTGGQNGQQNQYGTPYGAFNTAFRY